MKLEYVLDQLAMRRVNSRRFIGFLAGEGYQPMKKRNYWSGA
jgi:hypothetical protein